VPHLGRPLAGTLLRGYCRLPVHSHRPQAARRRPEHPNAHRNILSVKCWRALAREDRHLKTRMAIITMPRPFDEGSLKLVKVFSCVCLVVHRAVFMFGHLRDPCLNVRMILVWGILYSFAYVHASKCAVVRCFRCGRLLLCLESSIRRKTSDSRGLLAPLWQAPSGHVQLL